MAHHASDWKEEEEVSMKVRMQVQCKHCEGNGYTPQEIPCTWCNEQGFTFRWVDLEQLVKDALRDVLEHTTFTGISAEGLHIED